MSGPNSDRFSDRPIAAASSDAERASGAFSEKPLPPLAEDDLPDPDRLRIEARHIARSRMTSRHADGVAGANWFFIIAGLALVASFTSTGVPFIGLGLTHLVDVLLPEQRENAIRETSVGATALAAVVFLAFGWYSRKGLLAVYAGGMALYAIDGLLTLLLMNPAGAFCHACILYRLWWSFRAFWEMHAIDRDLSKLE